MKIVNKRMSMLRGLQSGSAMYVVVHARMRSLQGRRPSCVYGGVRNPRLALKLAWKEIDRRAVEFLDKEAKETLEAGLIETQSKHVKMHCSNLGPHTNSNPHYCIDCGKSLGTVTSYEQCFPKKKYTRVGVNEVMSEMTRLIISPYDHDVANAFIEEHPWTLKYVSDGFSEAEQLREMSETQSDFGIIPDTVSDQEKAFCLRNGFKQVVRYVTSGKGRTFTFHFDQVEPDGYLAVSG